MKYFWYQALLQDGERVEHVTACIVISAADMRKFGLGWMRERIEASLSRLVRFDCILEATMKRIPLERVRHYTDSPWTLVKGA
jgi:hypothetical protein